MVSDGWLACRSLGRTHSEQLHGQASTASLDIAADLVLAQLGPLPNAPSIASVHSTAMLQAATSAVAVSETMVGIPAGSSASPGLRSMCQDWGSVTSPFAGQASPETPCSAHSTKRSAATSEGRPSCASSSSSPFGCVAENDTSRRPGSGAAVPDALKEGGEGPGHLSSSLLIKEDGSGVQSDHGYSQGSQACSTASQFQADSMTTMKEGAALPSASEAPKRASLQATQANTSCRAAQRRRTRQTVSIQPDQENTAGMHMQSVIPEDLVPPELAVQKPLESTTNLFRKRATSLQAEYLSPDCSQADCSRVPGSPEHDDGRLASMLAALGSAATGAQAATKVMTREDVYKPLSRQRVRPPQLPPVKLLSRTIRVTAGLQRLAKNSDKTAASSMGMAEQPSMAPERRHANESQAGCEDGGLQTGGQKEDAADPAYMQSTASVRAKADVAVQKLKACRAAQQAKRRWSY